MHIGENTNEPLIRQISEDSYLLSFALEQTMPKAALQQRICDFAQRLRLDDSLPLLEIVPGVGSLLLQLRNEAVLSSAATMTENEVLAYVKNHWDETDSQAGTGKIVEIPVVYGGSSGPDLETLAQNCSLNTHQVIELHSQTTYHVYCIGFQPGFAYMGGQLRDEQTHLLQLRRKR